MFKNKEEFDHSLGILSKFNNTNFIQLINKSKFSIKCAINYSFKGSQFNDSSSGILSGNTKFVNLPDDAININVIIIMFNELGKEVTIYNHNFSSINQLKLLITGTIESPKCTLIPYNYNEARLGEGPKMAVSKTVNPTTANIGEVVTFKIEILNSSMVDADNVFLMEKLPQGATLVPNSLNVDGDIVNGSILPPQGIRVGDVDYEDAEIITYKVIFNSIPATNPVAVKPIINYSYLSVSGQNQSALFVGNVTPLTITESTEPPQPPEPPEGPKMTVFKTVNPNTASIGEVVTFKVEISNSSIVDADNIFLMEKIPQKASFVPNSLNVDGDIVYGNTLPAEGIRVGDVDYGDTEIVTYQVIFNSIPATNPVAIKPIINYSYVIAPGQNQSASFTGNVTPLTITESTEPPEGPKMTVFKTVNPNTASIGEVVTFKVEISNSSIVDADNIFLMEKIPQKASFVPNSLNVDGDIVYGNTLPAEGIRVGDVDYGDTEIVTYQVIFNSIPATNPVAIKPIINYSYVIAPGQNQSASFTGNVTPLTITESTEPPQPPEPPQVPSMVVLKRVNPTTANVGQVVTFKVEILNTSTTSADNVFLMEKIPEGASFVPNSLNVDGDIVSGNILPVEGIKIGDVDYGDTEIVTYQVIFNSIPATNPVAIKPTINYSYLSASGQNQSASFTGTVIPLIITKPTEQPQIPEITVMKSANSSVSAIGEIVTFQIDISNNSVINVNDVFLMEKVPQGATFVENSLNVDGKQIKGDNLPINGIKIGDVSSGDTEIVTYQVIFNSIPAINPVAINPIINYTYIDNVGQNQSVSFIGTVKPIIIINVTGTPEAPSMTVFKSSNPSRVAIGQVVTFQINVSNSNMISANNVFLMEKLPEGSVFVPKSLTIGGEMVNGTNLPASIGLGTISYGEIVIVTYKVIFESMPITNPVEITPIINYNYIDNEAENQLASFTGTVVPLMVIKSSQTPETPLVPLLFVLKIANTALAYFGQIITFKIGISNNDGIKANNTILVDKIPKDAIFVPNSLKIDGKLVIGNDFPNEGIKVGNIQVGSTATVSYQIILTSISKGSQLEIKPILKYSYSNATGENEETSFTGNVMPIKIKDSNDSSESPSNKCCCCCCFEDCTMFDKENLFNKMIIIK